MNSDKDHNVAIYSKEGKLLAIYGPDGKGNLKSLRGLLMKVITEEVHLTQPLLLRLAFSDYI